MDQVQDAERKMQDARCRMQDEIGYEKTPEPGLA